jgi:hypothetical protein
MTTHIQQNDFYRTQEELQLPRPSLVALVVGIVLAGFLVFLSPPLLVAAGLWLLGMALTLIGYALAAKRKYDTAAWDTAIIGQGLGLLGMALLFSASLLG